MKKETHKELRFDLLDNAKDFIEEAVLNAKQVGPRSWKYSLVHLTSALELLIKALLEKEHWSLLFNDIDKASKEKLGSGNFRSVDSKTAQQRLDRIAGHELSSDHTAFLTQLRDLRNRIMHFRFTVSEQQIKSLVQRGWAVFVDLYESGYGTSHDPDWIHEITQKLVEFEQFVKERLQQLLSRIQKAERPSKHFRKCSMCAQDTLVINDNFEEVVCLFCGERQSILDLACIYEGAGGPCPSCDNGYLGFVLHNNDYGEFRCVICDFVSEYNYNEECSRCGQVFWNKHGEVMCEDCWESIMQDD